MSSMDPRYQQPPHLERDTERLGRAGFAAAADLWQRCCALGIRHAARAGENALAAWKHLPEPDVALNLWVSGTRDLLQDASAASSASLQHFSGTLAGARGTPLSAMHEVDGKAVMLPARIREASQAMAMWALPTAAASAALAARLGADAARFNVLDLGDGSSPFALFMVDYRESDLGAYHELGAAFFVRPACDPGAAPGMFMVDLPVDQAFTCQAGIGIWGYPKTLEHIALDYRAERVGCEFRRRGRGKAPGRHVLSVSFPRGGEGSSTEVPMATYTMREGRACMTVFTRSGSGETMRGCSAGAVCLQLGKPGDPLVDMLRTLGVAQATPMLHGWTEHMSGHFGIPAALAPG